MQPQNHDFGKACPTVLWLWTVKLLLVYSSIAAASFVRVEAMSADEEVKEVPKEEEPEKKEEEPEKKEEASPAGLMLKSSASEDDDDKKDA
jgi:hypothetical protein